MRCIVVFVVLGAGLVSCGPPAACTPGATATCACPGGVAGAQTCNVAGTGYESCRCGVAPGDGGADACQPACAGHVCGDNGCGASCGNCQPGQTCQDGACATAPCAPNCGGRTCGSDGCMGQCGACGAGQMCNQMTGQCTACAPTCAGRLCGTDGCGTLCGRCPTGQTCNTTNGTCSATCAPNCAGRSCGFDGCSGTCGACPTGQACTPAGQCQAMCFAMPGQACGTDADCCPDHGVPTRCARLYGLGTVCTARCTAPADCASACCASLTDGSRVCDLALWCASTASCSARVGQTCRGDSDCCHEATGLMNPTACGCFGASCSCAALCSQNSDCVSNCCVRRTDGVLICADASHC